MHKNSTVKIISRIRGGIGNQLFCYAAARRLAHINGAELVIDDVTGFVRDHTYNRKYELDGFSIPLRKANWYDRMEPMERWNRGLAKWRARQKPYFERRYIEEVGEKFDERLLSFVPRGTVYLDGLWQDERYFSDISDMLQNDLKFSIEPCLRVRELARQIEACDSVALHVRWFSPPGSDSESHNLVSEYYQHAIEKIEREIPSAHFFLFSDDLKAAVTKINIKEQKLTVVDHSRGESAALLDLWLMSQCRHFIIANSTFSWWGAWLGRSKNKERILLMPQSLPKIQGGTVLGPQGIK